MGTCHLEDSGGPRHLRGPMVARWVGRLKGRGARPVEVNGPMGRLRLSPWEEGKIVGGFGASFS